MTRYGFKNKDYNVRLQKCRIKTTTKSNRYKMRRDSFIKLLQKGVNDSEKHISFKRTRDHSGMDRAVRSTDSSYCRMSAEWEELDQDSLDYIKEKVEEYDYNVKIIPEDDEVKVWNLALGAWTFKVPEMELKEE